MPSLNLRIAKLEEHTASGAYVPAPEGGVYFAGPRDPVAIMRALGLQDVRCATIDVLTRGQSPDAPPRLAGSLTKSGRAGMSEEFRLFAPLACCAFPSGEAWSFHWEKGGRGWIMDETADDYIRYYDCPADDSRGDGK